MSGTSDPGYRRSQHSFSKLYQSGKKSAKPFNQNTHFFTLYLLPCQEKLPKAIRVSVVVSLACLALLTSFVCCFKFQLLFIYCS